MFRGNSGGLISGFCLMDIYHLMKNNGCFSSTSRFGLPDVLFCVTGESPNSPISEKCDFYCRHFKSRTFFRGLFDRGLSEAVDSCAVGLARANRCSLLILWGI